MRNKELPRLQAAMQWVAILSKGEAVSCIRMYRDGYDFAGEAVDHFGGCHAVIAAASKRGTREFMRSRQPVRS